MMENTPSNEMPPEWMWHIDHALIDHFKKIKEKQDHPERFEQFDPDMGEIEENEYAMGMRG